MTLILDDYTRIPSRGAELMQHKILLVDDEEAVREVMEGLLTLLDYPCVSRPDGKAALDVLGRDQFSVLITDMDMPIMSGLQLVEEARKRDAELGIIVVTGLGSLSVAINVMKQGANEYLLKPIQFDALAVAIEKCLEKRQLQLEIRAYKEELEQKVVQRTAQLTSALTALQTAHQGVKQAYLDMVTVLAKAAESNDTDTGNHVRRVAAYVSVVATKLGYPREQAERIAHFSTAHDIGKVTVHPDILRKPGKLSNDEFEAMKHHTTRGAEILRQSPTLALAADIAMSHHERYDGLGYPLGLHATEIPVEARITTLADVFDALTMKRCYKEAWSMEEAFMHIRDESDRHFDPSIAAVFLDSAEEIKHIRASFPE